MKCPECNSENLWIEDGPELGLGSDEIVCLLWQCNECGARWVARYDLKLRNIEMMRNRNASES